MKDSFKLDNKKRIRHYIIIILFLLFTNILLLSLPLFIPFKKAHKAIFIMFLLIIMSFLCIKLWRSRFFEIENSGMVCTIKLYSPLRKGWIIPIVEFPVSVLEDFSLRNGQFYIQLKRHDGLHTKVRLYVMGLTKNQNQQLRTYFNKIVNNTETTNYEY